MVQDDGAIQQRLSGDQGAVKRLMHRARCFMPAAAAGVLRVDPQLISLAVEAVCTGWVPLSFRCGEGVCILGLFRNSVYVR